MDIRVRLLQQPVALRPTWREAVLMCVFFGGFLFLGLVS